MNFLFPRYSALRLLAFALPLLVSADAFAQAQGRGNTQTRRPTTNTNAGRGTTATGGGGGTGRTTAGDRQYINSTMVGEALVTSDLETRRLIIVTDDETNENIRTIVESLDKPKPQVLINVVFVQVSYDKGMDLGAEVSYAGSVAINAEPGGRAPDIASTKFGLADAALDPTHPGAFYRILGRDVDGDSVGTNEFTLEVKTIGQPVR